MKKVIAVILVVGMFISFTGSATAVTTGFTDLTGSEWFYEHVSVLVDAGIINGYNDHTFKPSRTIQVDEFIKTMVVALGYTPGNDPTYWAQLYIDQAISLGIISSTDFSSYNRPITRAEMAMICEGVVEMLEGTKTYNLESDIISRLTDYSSVTSTGYESSILHVYELGIITGYPDGSFGPTRQLMRSEASTVIRRIIDTTIRQPFVGGDIGRLASYPRDTSGIYRPATEFETSAEIQADIDLALGWVNVFYNFDYRTTTYSDYRSTLEWYYSPALTFGGKTADVYLDWVYDYSVDVDLIMEAYGVTDISLVYQSSGGDLVVPITIYFKYTNKSDLTTIEPSIWYRQDVELSFVNAAESQEEKDMWPHSNLKFYGEKELANAVKVGE